MAISQSSLTSPKVIAATGGTGAGAVISTLVVWLLGAFVFGGTINAADAEATLAAVPLPVTAFVALVLTAGGTFISGYLTTDPAREASPAPRRALDESEQTV